MKRSGATVKNVTRLFNQYMIDTGQAMSRDAKTELLDSNLTDVDLSTAEALAKAVGVIVKKGTSVTDASAAALIRAWAKKAEVACYKAPASEGTRNPFIPMFHSELVKNPQMTEDELKGLIAGLEKEEWKVNPTRWITVHNNTRLLANTIYKNCTEAAAA